MFKLSKVMIKRKCFIPVAQWLLVWTLKKSILFI